MIKKYLSILPEIGKKTWVAENASVIGRCKIGNDCGIWFGAIIRGDVNYITIGDRTNIQDLSMIHVAQSQTENFEDGHPTKIGDDVTIGHKAMLHGCKIGSRCLIGMNATLLDGCEIGEDSIVAAGSVVTQNKKFPPQSLILGSPAKVVRKISKHEISDILRSADSYVKYKNEYIEMNY